MGECDIDVKGADKRKFIRRERVLINEHRARRRAFARFLVVGEVDLFAREAAFKPCELRRFLIGKHAVYDFEIRSRDFARLLGRYALRFVFGQYLDRVPAIHVVHYRRGGAAVYEYLVAGDLFRSVKAREDQSFVHLAVGDNKPFPYGFEIKLGHVAYAEIINLAALADRPAVGMKRQRAGCPVSHKVEDMALSAVDLVEQLQFIGALSYQVGSAVAEDIERVVYAVSYAAVFELDGIEHVV